MDKVTTMSKNENKLILPVISSNYGANLIGLPKINESN